MNTLHGPLLMVAAMAGFAAEDALIKALAGQVPIGQIGVLLGVGGLTVFALWARAQGRKVFVSDALRGALLLRNLSEMLAVVFMLLGIALAPLTVVSAVLQAMPLTVTLGAAVFLREPVGWRRWSAILVGFVGVLLIIGPGGTSFDPVPEGAVAAAGMETARDLATRRIPAHVASVQVSAWGFGVVIPSGIMMFLVTGAQPVVMSPWAWMMMGFTLGAGIVGYVCLVAATRAGDLAQTTPFRYSRLVFGMAIGIIVFDERPDAVMLMGAGLVVLAGFYALMREIRLSRRNGI